MHSNSIYTKQTSEHSFLRLHRTKINGFICTRNRKVTIILTRQIHVDGITGGEQLQ